MIATATRLKLIQKIGVGVNTIDLDAARQRGIPVCNLPGTNARAVAEMTLATNAVRPSTHPGFDQGCGKASGPTANLQDGLGELAGSTVGLVGYGAIPRSSRRSWWRWAVGDLHDPQSNRHGRLASHRPLDQLLAEPMSSACICRLVPETRMSSMRGRWR